MSPEPSPASAAPGTLLFKSACGVLLIFAALHLFAVYNANFVTPSDPRVIEMQRAARAVEQPMGPFKPTAAGGIQILNTSYSILLFQVAVLNLLALPGWVVTGRLRRATFWNILFVAMLLGVTIIFQFPPPMIFAGLALLLFVLSYSRQRPGTATGD